MICKHSGKSGDLIYSLYAIKNLKRKSTLLITNKRITPYFFGKLRRLLLAQPYINKVKYIDKDKRMKDGVVNLDLWRKLRRANKFKFWILRANGDFEKARFCQHIVQTHVDAVNREYNLKLPKFAGEPWLHNVKPSNRKGKYIVIQRSEGLHSRHFDYSKHIPKGHCLLFVGARREFKAFSKEYPGLSLICLGNSLDFLEAASLIKGSEFFIGNQSICSAIAQGLGHPQIQEAFERVPNCLPKVVYKE